MNSKTKTLLYLFSFLGLFLIVLITYLYKSVDGELMKKRELFISLSTLPDLAISDENFALRHRTLSDISSIYPLDGTLRESSLTSFSIANSKGR